VTETYEDLRPLLFSIAYRMLGSVAEAEDVVQDAFLRYHDALGRPGAEIESPKAYLSAVTTRLAIDHLRSARVRRESYVGEWLPEPLLTDESAPDAARYAEDADSLSMAFLLVLERLSPVERAVFLLHDVFDYGFGEVASIVGKSEANTRQLAVRARRHVEAEKPRFEASREQRDERAARFFDAVGDGDMEASSSARRRRSRRRRRWRQSRVLAAAHLRPRQGRPPHARPRQTCAAAQRDDAAHAHQRAAGRSVPRS
jgi:RNA polymerase sigma-70 factor (ECF subfamily)